MQTVVPFVKVEGLGNDFVLVDFRTRHAPPLSLAQAVALCDRHKGIGADGVLTLLAPSTEHAVARMVIQNADGSVPEMCGNGLRCVARFLTDVGAIRPHHRAGIDTGAGLRFVDVAALGGGLVTIDMGRAHFAVPGQIPTWFQQPLHVAGIDVHATAVSMGNPHLVLFTTPDVALAQQVGPLLEHDAHFPQRTNVEFATARSDGSIDVVVWERGVGITQACGTGACAVAAAFARAGLCPKDTDVVVHLPGGPLSVRVPSNADDSVWMTGPARVVFRGEVVLDNTWAI